MMPEGSDYEREAYELLGMDTSELTPWEDE